MTIIIVLSLAIPVFILHSLGIKNNTIAVISDEENKNKFIKYAEFNVPYEALEKAMNADINSHDKEIKINWIEVLSFLAAKYGGDFKSHYNDKDLENIIDMINSGKSIDDLSKNIKTYGYFREVYTAVLGEFIGNYSIQVDTNKDTNEPIYEEKYGLKVFSPIAKTFPYQHYDDFGCKRTYGYSRPHLGHDMMAATGTPVVAIESGTVEVMGWNQYGGWRIGIRSFDKKRYYYYAHLRKDKPFHEDISEGSIVKAGDVIGYVGRTGYSSHENVNNIETSHLHLGLELVFDESQKESNNEIWIDMYNIAKLLSKNKSEVERSPGSKQYHRKYDFKEPLLDGIL